MGYCYTTTATWMGDINAPYWIPCWTVSLSSHLHGSFFTRNVNALKRPLLDCATQTILCSLPSANSLIQKCLKTHVRKYLRSEKRQSESCCPLKIKNLQTQYADNLVTSVERSNVDISKVYTSRKIKDEIKVREDKPPLVNQQCVVYYFKCDLCDAGYVGYTRRHLHQRIEPEHKGSAVGNHLREQHDLEPDDIASLYRISHFRSHSK